MGIFVLNRLSHVSHLSDVGLTGFAILGASEWPGLRRVQKWLQLAQQGLDVVQVFGYFVRWQDVFVEVLVEHAGHGEKAADVAVAGFGPEPACRD